MDTGITSRPCRRSATPATTWASPPRTPRCCPRTTSSSRTTRSSTSDASACTPLPHPATRPGRCASRSNARRCFLRATHCFPAVRAPPNSRAATFPRSSDPSRTVSSCCLRRRSSCPATATTPRSALSGPIFRSGSTAAGEIRARKPHLRYDERPEDDTPIHTDALPPTPQRDRNIPARAWIEAPEALLHLGDDIGGDEAQYKRRIGPWLLWRSGPATGADARYLAIDGGDLTR